MNNGFSIILDLNIKDKKKFRIKSILVLLPLWQTSANLIIITAHAVNIVSNTAFKSKITIIIKHFLCDYEWHMVLPVMFDKTDVLETVYMWSVKNSV